MEGEQVEVGYWFLVRRTLMVEEQGCELERSVWLLPEQAVEAG